MTLLRVLLAALTILLRACTTTGAPADVPAQSSYTLVPGMRVDIGGNATLVYDSFNDSRCPANVKCIWAGEVVYRFTLATPKVTESFSLGLHKTVYVSPALNGAKLSLNPTDIPAPPKTVGAPQQSRVVLTVARP